MNITNIIQEELGQTLEKAGFHSTFHERNIWPYEREKNGIKQEIVIITDRYNRKEIKVLFNTSAYGQRTKEFRDFVPESGATCWEFWGYKNEDELRAVLKEFKRLIATYGLDFLEKLSKPATDAIPTEEMERYLYLNHQRLYEEYRVKMQTEGKSVEEVIEIIYQTMEQNLDQTFENVRDLLIGIAALYGHTISWGDRGKWVWDDEEKNCQLQEILGTRYNERLLKLIFPIWDYWRKNKCINKGLFERYKVIQVFYYEMHPEEIEYEE